jgi:hypothetical protein
MPSLERITTDFQEYLSRACQGEQFEFITGDNGRWYMPKSLEYFEISHVILKDGSVDAKTLLACLTRKLKGATSLQNGEIESVELFGEYLPDKGKPETERVFTEENLRAAAEGKFRLK